MIQFVVFESFEYTLLTEFCLNISNLCLPVARLSRVYFAHFILSE